MSEQYKREHISDGYCYKLGPPVIRQLRSEWGSEIYFLLYVSLFILHFCLNLFSNSTVAFLLYLSNLFVGVCSAHIPQDLFETVDGQCSQKYTFKKGSDTHDYGPYWTSWPPLDGSDPLEGVNDQGILNFYDAFKYKSTGMY